MSSVLVFSAFHASLKLLCSVHHVLHLHILVHSLVHAQLLQVPCLSRRVSILDRADRSPDSNSVRSNHSA